MLKYSIRSIVSDAGGEGGKLENQLDQLFGTWVDMLRS